MPIPPRDITGAEVPQIFMDLRTARRTGTALFEFTQEQTATAAVKKVFWKNGEVIFAASNLQDDWLGRWMVRSGRITPQQCDASEELVRKTGRKQGALLVELGFIRPNELVDGVKSQVREIVLSLFPLSAASYSFDDGPLPAADIIPLQMSIGNLVLHGLRQLDWQAARKSLPPPDSILRLSTDPSILFQKADLTQDEAAILALVDGNRSIEEICTLSGLGDFNALRAVHVLLSLRMAGTGAVKTEEDLRLAREAIALQADARKQAPSVTEPAATREVIEKAFAEMPQMSHYEVLGVQQNAGEGEIKKAYFRLAKRYHPDRHFDEQMQDMKEKLDALFAMIHNAYETLSDPARRREYDRAPVQQPATRQFEQKRPEDYVENYAEKAARAAAYFKEGMKQFTSGNFWGAVESFTWATRLDPVKAAYFYQNGLALSRIPRRKHDAEESLLRAIEIDPMKTDFYLGLGSLYLASGLRTKAQEVYAEALRLNPESDTIRQAIRKIGGTVEEKMESGSKGGIFRKMFGKE